MHEGVKMRKCMSKERFLPSFKENSHREYITSSRCHLWTPPWWRIIGQFPISPFWGRLSEGWFDDNLRGAWIIWNCFCLSSNYGTVQRKIFCYVQTCRPLAEGLGWCIHPSSLWSSNGFCGSIGFFSGMLTFWYCWPQYPSGPIAGDKSRKHCALILLPQQSGPVRVYGGERLHLSIS